MRDLPIVVVYLLWLGACSLAVDEEARGFAASVDAASDAPQTASLIVNEVAPKGRPEDWFELYNGSAAPIDLDDYSYSDSADRPAVAFRESLTIQPGNYHVEFLDDEHPGFGFGSEEAILLYKGTPLVNGLRWTDADAIDDEGSFARLPDVQGQARATLRVTPGYPNEADDSL